MLLLLMVLPIASAPASSAETRHWTLNQQDSGRILGSEIQYWREITDQPLTLQELLTMKPDWQQHPDTIPNFGLSPDAYWFHVSFYLPQASDQWRLNIEFPLLDQVDLYVQNDRQTLQQAQFGDAFPFSNRPVRHRNFHIPLQLSAAGYYDIYIRVKSQGSMQVPVAFWLRDQQEQINADDYMQAGLYIGFIVAILIFNLFIAITTREKYIFYFVCFLLAYLLFYISLSGFGFEYLWPDNLWLQERLTILSVSSACIFSALFAQRFLRLRETQKHLHRINRLCFYLPLLTLMASFVIDYQLAVKITMSSTIIASLLSLLIGIRVALKRTLSGFFYAAGWLILLGGVIIHSMSKEGLLPITPFIEYSSHIGSIMLVCIHSMAIALRFYEERQQHKLTLEQMTEAQRESLRSRYRMQEAELQRKQTESENQAKSAFLAMMSHEIRTPLNGVLGMVQLLTQTRLDQQQQRYLETINASGKSLLTILNDILDLSKMNSGKLQLEMQDVALHELISDCLTLYSQQAKEKGLTLLAFMHLPLYQTIYSDPTRLRQIINNLLSNAVKFTDSGSITLDLSFHEDTLLIRIKDTGIGISDEYQSRLFEHFSQADASTSRHYGGTGLGLSICKQLVTLLGGEISARSHANEGTEFIVTLPGCQPANPLKPEKITAGRVHIQLSNNDERELLTRFMLELGFQITGEKTADIIFSDQPCINLHNNQEQHIIYLCDKNMPGLEPWRQLVRPLKTSSIVRRLNGQGMLYGNPLNAPSLQLSDRRIWVAEDNPVNQKVIAGMLNHLHLHYELFNNGQSITDAWQAMPESQRPDLILMDCEMPLMDGFTATLLLRESEQSLTTGKRVPVIALTAHALPEYRDRALNNGFDDFLSKPIHLEQLRQLCLHWLQIPPS
ncbi:MAG: ATP-binding protein [Saccharospirillaceae bacterium]|nr:ATP-binding protein [Saccharospirillaceae bacterium]MCD8531599.1 ATP-binding protein [Saccharospirillaceae bacterium]